jgi:hypothetical protein
MIPQPARSECSPAWLMASGEILSSAVPQWLPQTSPEALDPWGNPSPSAARIGAAPDMAVLAQRTASSHAECWLEWPWPKYHQGRTISDRRLPKLAWFFVNGLVSHLMAGHGLVSPRSRCTGISRCAQEFLSPITCARRSGRRNSDC